MKIGDKVRVIGIPRGLKNRPLKTRDVFTKCLGHVFPVVSFQGPLLELEVGELFAKPAPCETIWIEPELVEQIPARRPRQGRAKKH